MGGPLTLNILGLRASKSLLCGGTYLSASSRGNWGSPTIQKCWRKILLLCIAAVSHCEQRLSRHLINEETLRSRDVGLKSSHCVLTFINLHLLLHNAFTLTFLDRKTMKCPPPPRENGSFCHTIVGPSLKILNLNQI